MAICGRSHRFSDGWHPIACVEEDNDDDDDNANDNANDEMMSLLQSRKRESGQGGGSRAVVIMLPLPLPAKKRPLKSGDPGGEVVFSTQGSRRVLCLVATARRHPLGVTRWSIVISRL